ncbi:MAG: hypothetical protein HXY34_10180 [Candidatus Thorarchaeota archaeon]|nr:hypothetical protein [Candidatus Thorarchaeota archaeon]
MNTRREPTAVDSFMVVVFIVFLAVNLYLVFSGYAWHVLTPSHFHLCIEVVTPIVVLLSGNVFTFAVVYYGQLRTVRSIMVLCIASNMALLALLYSVTHPVFEDWLPVLADRNRNMNVVVVLGLSLMPLPLAASLSAEKVATPRVKTAYLLYGGVLIPLTALACVLSPSPLFIVIGPSGGLAGLTAIGWVVVVVIVSTAVASVLSYSINYLRTRDWLSLCFALATGMWTSAALVLVVLWNPFQVAEVLWFCDLACGMGLVAITMMVHAILEPFSAMEREIQSRTVDLEKSNRESEFYLLSWAHKVGNLIQGVMLHLELAAEARRTGSNPSDSELAAAELSAEAALINRHVAWLAQVKSAARLPLEATDPRGAIANACSTVSSMLSVDQYACDVTGDDVSVLADSNLSLLVATVLYLCLKNSEDPSKPLGVRIERRGDRVRVSFLTGTPEIVRRFTETLEAQSHQGLSTVNLDVYMSSLLLERYGAHVDKSGLDSGELTFVFIAADGHK